MLPLRECVGERARATQQQTALLSTLKQLSSAIDMSTLAS